MDPDTPSIINGGVMKLSGPCFSASNKTITCKFNDSNGKEVHEPINGIITNNKGNEKAICPMPLFKTLGGHSVVITVDNGKMYNGSFTVGEYKIQDTMYLHVLAVLIIVYISICMYSYIIMYIYSIFTYIRAYVYTYVHHITIQCKQYIRMYIHSYNIPT